MTGIVDLLSRSRPNRHDLGFLRRAAAHPSAWTAATTPLLQALAIPEPPRLPGRPLLLAVNDDGRGSLWTMTSAEPRTPIDREFAGKARDAWLHGRRVAHRSLPLVSHGVDTRAARDVRARLLSCEGGPVPAKLDGLSFGLSMVMGEWSIGAETPLDPTVAASATVDAVGRLGKVEGLSEKLAAVAVWAPAVRQLVVFADQADEAKRAAAELGLELEVHGLRAVEDAWEIALPGLEATLRDRWGRSAELRKRAIRNLFRTVLLEDHAGVRWSAAGRAASILAELSEGDDRWRAQVVQSATARLEGRPLRIPVDEGAESRLTPTARLALWTNRVEQVVDLAEPETAWRAEAAGAEVLLVGDDRPEELRLRGALGRLYANYGEPTTATNHLRRAIQGWEAEDRLPEASRAICALLGVARGMGGAWAEAAEGWAVACLDEPRTLPRSRAFLALALARFYHGSGREGEAENLLVDDEFDWAEAPAHLAASRVRWVARLGCAVNADPMAELAELAGKHASEAGWALFLARVDSGEVTTLDGAPPLVRDCARRLAAAGRGASAADVAEAFPY